MDTNNFIVEIDCGCKDKRPCCYEEINSLKSSAYKQLIIHHQTLKHSPQDHNSEDAWHCDCNRRKPINIHKEEICLGQKLLGMCDATCLADFPGIKGE